MKRFFYLITSASIIFFSIGMHYRSAFAAHIVLSQVDTSQYDSGREVFRATHSKFQSDQDNFELKKQTFTALIQSLIRYAELLQQRVNRFPVIEQELRDLLIADIYRDTTALQRLQERAINAENEEALSLIVHDLAEHRNSAVQEDVRKHMMLAHIGVFEYQVIQTAVLRADSIEIALHNLENNGVEVGSFYMLLGNARSNIYTAILSLEQLKKAAAKQPMTDKNFQDIYNNLKDARKLIIDAYHVFSKIAEGVE